jgi:hypothetical protein
MLTNWVSTFLELKMDGYANYYEHYPRLPGV